MNEKKPATKTIVTTGMFTAIISVISILEIPFPSGVPVTLQTFAVALCGYVLGWRQGALCVFLYVLLGAAGVPIYAGMTAGFAELLGVTGGFLFGFIPMAALCGFGAKCSSVNQVFPILLGIAGLAFCHILGGLQFSMITGNSFWSSMLVVSIPYLVKDILSTIGAYFVSLALKTSMRRANVLV